MIQSFRKYYINTDTQEIITREEFLTIMYKYINENIDEDGKLTVEDIECNYDEIVFIGSFSSKQDAINSQLEEV